MQSRSLLAQIELYREENTGLVTLYTTTYVKVRSRDLLALRIHPHVAPPKRSVYGSHYTKEMVELRKTEICLTTLRAHQKHSLPCSRTVECFGTKESDVIARDRCSHRLDYYHKEYPSCATYRLLGSKNPVYVDNLTPQHFPQPSLPKSNNLWHSTRPKDLKT